MPDASGNDWSYLFNANANTQGDPNVGSQSGYAGAGPGKGKFEAFFDPTSLWYGGKGPGLNNAKPLRRAGYEGQSWLDSMRQIYPEMFGLSRQTAQDYGGLATDTLGQLTTGRGNTSVDAAASWMRGLNPTATNVRDTLGEQVGTDLQAGDRFTTDQEEELRRQAIQAARARGAQSGLGASNVGYADELLSQFNVGQALKASRQNAATSYLQGQYQQQTAPALQQGQFTDQSNIALMQSILNGGVNAPTVNPYNEYNADLQNTNLNAFYENLFSKRQASAAKSAGGLGALGSIGGGLLGAAGSVYGGYLASSGAGATAGSAAAACWVAREVYGAENPRWRVFRDWMLTEAPAWFRKLYLQHGAKFAAWLRPRPLLKRMIRVAMDLVVNRRVPQPN